MHSGIVNTHHLVASLYQTSQSFQILKIVDAGELLYLNPSLTPTFIDVILHITVLQADHPKAFRVLRLELSHQSSQGHRALPPKDIVVGAPRNAYAPQGQSSLAASACADLALHAQEQFRVCLQVGGGLRLK